jgi:HEAT repeat protein
MNNQYYDLILDFDENPDSAAIKLKKNLSADPGSIPVLIKLMYSRVWGSREKIAQILIDLGTLINPHIILLLTENTPGELKKWCLYLLSHTAESEDVLQIMNINSSWPEDQIAESLILLAEKADFRGVKKIIELLKNNRRSIQKAAFSALENFFQYHKKNTEKTEKNSALIKKEARVLLLSPIPDYQYWGIKLLNNMDISANLELLGLYMKNKKCPFLIFALARYASIRNKIRNSFSTDEIDFLENRLFSALKGIYGWYIQKETLLSLSHPLSPTEEDLLFQLLNQDNIVISAKASFVLSKGGSGLYKKLVNSLFTGPPGSDKWILKAILDSDFSDGIEKLFDYHKLKNPGENEYALILECLGSKTIDTNRLIKVIHEFIKSENWFLRYKAIEGLNIFLKKQGALVNAGSPENNKNMMAEKIGEIISRALRDTNELVRTKALDIKFELPDQKKSRKKEQENK